MSSILKVNTIQDQDGNNIINENANVITIGASGDTITVPAGATVSGFTSAGIDDNATSVAITIDSSENVGIGTSSPATTLHVSGGTANTVSLIESTDAYAWLSVKDNSSANSYINSIGASGDNLQIISKDITFRTASAPNVSTGTYGTERMRIDSSGNTMFGKTTQGDVSIAGAEIRSNGTGTFTRDGDTVLIANRRTSDGTIQEFRKGNTAVGKIGAGLGQFYIGQNNTGFILQDTNQRLAPSNADGSGNDANITLGWSNRRFKDLYLSGGLYVGGTGTANKLDDYEEGTWTPQVQDNSSNNASMGSSAQNYGKYTKVGNIVFVAARVETASVSGLTGTNTVFISGLPFTGGNQRSTGAVNFHDFNLPSGATALSLYFDSSVDKFQLFKERSGSNMTGLTVSEFGVTSFGFSATYITD